MDLTNLPSSDSSVGKESTCNAEDTGSIPGLRRCVGQGIGYPPQYSWAFLVAQLVKNSPAMQEAWVGSLGWEDPLEKGKATHSSILAWRIPWTSHGVTKRQAQLSDFHSFTIYDKRGKTTQCRKDSLFNKCAGKTGQLHVKK